VLTPLHEHNAITVQGVSIIAHPARQLLPIGNLHPPGHPVTVAVNKTTILETPCTQAFT